jgi:quercetin dioxygenase-like cupin family protein
MRAEGLAPGSWSNGPGDVYASHRHDYDKVLACERGSIVFGVEGEAVELAAGDRLELPAGTPHSAVVGPMGVTCLEAHLPAGRLVALRHSHAGEW